MDKKVLFTFLTFCILLILGFIYFISPDTVIVYSGENELWTVTCRADSNASAKLTIHYKGSESRITEQIEVCIEQGLTKTNIQENFDELKVLQSDTEFSFMCAKPAADTETFKVTIHTESDSSIINLSRVSN
ncbi:hypothetical protein AALA00_00250 [Lachnospiraceae bacterium 46-15]